MRMRGGNFGSVSMPGFPLPEVPIPVTARIGLETVQPSQPVEPPAQNTCDAVMPLLANTNPTSPKLKELRATILAQAAEFIPRWDAFLGACIEERQSALTKQHVDIRAAGRKQQALCAHLNGGFMTANTTWNRAIEAKARAMNALEAARYQRKHLSRMASNAEIATADGKVERAKQAARVAIQEEATAINERNMAEDKLLTARAELAAIAQQEYRIKAALDGQPYHDPELGLAVPA